MATNYRLALVLMLGVLVTACGNNGTGSYAKSLIEMRQKYTTDQASVSKYVTTADLRNCAGKVKKSTVGWGGAKYRLTGPLRQDARLACLDSGNYSHQEPVAYYAAPAVLVSGYGGILMPKKSKFLWCRFRLVKGAAKIEKWSVGMTALKGRPRQCGFRE